MSTSPANITNRCYWEPIIRSLLTSHSTPFFAIAMQPIAEALAQFGGVHTVVPLRHWFSFKTHPVPSTHRWWRALGLGMEVVSEFEFLAAVREGFTPENILVNGVAKHGWLPRHPAHGLNVNFDSLTEVEQMRGLAYDKKWTLGLRLHVKAEYNPDEPEYGGQFGMSWAEAREALRLLREADLKPKVLHFHLRSSMESPRGFREALKEAARFCAACSFQPTVIDCGGGLPAKVDEEMSEVGSPVFRLSEFAEILEEVPTRIPSVREIWLENGRFFTARTGVLVVTVRDVKERADSRYLICDGGRVNQALVSDWEHHAHFLIPDRSGRSTHSTVCGPTCMAYDWLFRAGLSREVGVGDAVVWLDAGAYHFSWENRFSNGLAKILWAAEDHRFREIRPAEGIETWWAPE